MIRTRSPLARFSSVALLATGCMPAVAGPGALPAVSAANPSLAVPAADPPPDLTVLLRQMREAAGGEHWSGVRALHVVGKEVSGGTEVRVEHWEDVVAGRYRVQATKPDSVVQEGFDGVTSWRQGRSGIAYSLGDVDAALVAGNESFRVSRAWWFPERHAATIALSRTHTEGARTFDVLHVTPEGGRPFEAWVDRATHLLARTDEQQAEDRVVTTYTDYHEVDGLQLPFTVRSGDGANTSFDGVETVQSVEVNPVTADSLYGLPPLPPSDVHLPANASNVEVPFRLTDDNRILVPLTVDGVKVEAEFDSGGGFILQPGTVAKLKLQTMGQQKQSGGGEGSTTSSTGRIDVVALGGVRVRRLGFHSFTFNPGAPDEALLGLEILQRFVVRLDFDRSIMTLTDPSAFDYHGRGAVVPFHFQDNQPEVKGTVDGVAGLFAIDTGDNSSLLLIAPFARRYDQVKRYDADIPYEGSSVGATRGVWARKRAATVTLDGADGRPAVQVHDPVTRISLQTSGFDANRNVSANIGLGILRQFNLTFDYARQRLIFEPNHFYGQREVYNRTGLRLKRDGTAWQIEVVYDRGPAADAGLKEGDTVLSINGKSADQVTDEARSQILTGPLGSEVVLVVRSAGIERKVSLTLRDVI